ncbi:MAG: PorT family protein [Saprospiraceae bacterium]|nr:PorT family protein [Candidatus Vicinibacter affinis]
MKKSECSNFVGILLFLIAVSSIHGQSSAGIRTGIHISRFRFNSEEEDAVKYMSTPYVSMTAEVFLSEYFSLQTELIYLQKAVRLYSQDAIDYSDFRMRMDVLELPILAKKEFYRLVYKVVLVCRPFHCVCNGRKNQSGFYGAKSKIQRKRKHRF